MSPTQTIAILQRAVNLLPSMVAYWDRDLVCRFANEAYRRWFGKGPESLIGDTLPNLLGPQLFALNEPYIRRALAGEEQEFERFVPHPDGGGLHSLAHYIPDRVDGVVHGFVVQVTETTAIKVTEERLRLSEASLERTSRVAGIAGWELDLRNDEIHWSGQCRALFDLTSDTQPCPSLAEALDHFPPTARRDLVAAMQVARTHGTAWELTLPFVTASGRQRWLRSLGEVEYEGLQPVRLVCALQDVSEQRHRQIALAHEQGLRAATELHAEKLRGLLGERDEMLNVLAHEVRQPLNNAAAALQGAAATLTEFGEKVASQRMVRAQTVLVQVLASIDNTLAVASQLARQGPIRREDTDIETLIQIAIADMPGPSRARIKLEWESRLQTLQIDPSLMRLALRNLLSNALKFSPPRYPVRVRVSDQTSPAALIIDVIDQGPGVPAQRLPELFERRAPNAPPLSGNAQPTGMGLGLYIVRRVMELHGGEVRLQENSSQGATFRLVVALAPSV